MSRVLVVDDDRTVSDVVARYLIREGHQVEAVADGVVALERASARPPDLVVLDLMLPGMSGLEVCRRIRDIAPIPVIMLTARGEEGDRVIGLELGADDYVTKPFSPRELVLRVRAVLRRNYPDTADRGPVSYDDGTLTIDEPRQQAIVYGKVADLTPTEWGILLALSANPGRVYSRLELINRVRGYEFEGYERSVDSHIKNLRRKIERDPRSPRIVLTVLGGGYRLGLRRDV
jgi:DNA-binding response OmpR family regulator